jgi:hypothetical protein
LGINGRNLLQDEDTSNATKDTDTDLTGRIGRRKTNRVTTGQVARGGGTATCYGRGFERQPCHPSDQPTANELEGQELKSICTSLKGRRHCAHTSRITLPAHQICMHKTKRHTHGVRCTRTKEVSSEFTGCYPRAINCSGCCPHWRPQAGRMQLDAPHGVGSFQGWCHSYRR